MLSLFYCGVHWNRDFCHVALHPFHGVLRFTACLFSELPRRRNTFETPPSLDLNPEISLFRPHHSAILGFSTIQSFDLLVAASLFMGGE